MLFYPSLRLAKNEEGKRRNETKNSFVKIENTLRTTRLNDSALNNNIGFDAKEIEYPSYTDSYRLYELFDDTSVIDPRVFCRVKFVMRY